MLLPAALLLAAAHKPPPPSGELILDAANPVIEAEVGGMPLRLRVDLDRENTLELNPAAAARLLVKWEDGMSMDVGRIRLESREADAILQFQGRAIPVELSEHGRDCCDGVDGSIGPDGLPFATVRWWQADAPAPNGSVTLPLEASSLTGLSAGAEPGLRLHFALGHVDTIGTAAAGGILTEAWDGRWGGPETRTIVNFGIARPVRPIAFTQPGLIAGFRFDQLLVRISDFGGDERLPADPVAPGDMVVTQHLRRQHAWAMIRIGGDRLSRCAEIVYTAVPRTLTLRCAFDQKP